MGNSNRTIRPVPKLQRFSGLAAALAAGFFLGWASSTIASAETRPPPGQRELFREGALLWPVYCAQCHNARPGSQFSPAQWDIITMHMRTQSVMPAKDMRAIKEFLKEAR